MCRLDNRGTRNRLELTGTQLQKKSDLKLASTDARDRPTARRASWTRASAREAAYGVALNSTTLFSVCSHTLHSKVRIVSRIKLGDANEPHRHTAPGARWLEGRDRPVSLGMKLRHVPPARKFIECINSVALI